MNLTNCRHCGADAHWSWDFFEKKPVLILKNKPGQHHKCQSTKEDIFPGWCLKCGRNDLNLVRHGYYFQLVEQYGLPHTCTENGETDITDISAGRCKYCKATNLLWVRENGRFRLVSTAGVKHSCPETDQVYKDWAEAKRINYAFEKAWINSKPDDHQCPKCLGNGHKVFRSKNKRLMAKMRSTERILVIKPCKHCKRIGEFSAAKKKQHLKALRRKYWPYRAGVHKWNPKDL